jgi:hypothetical protein
LIFTGLRISGGDEVNEEGEFDVVLTDLRRRIRRMD